MKAKNELHKEKKIQLQAWIRFSHGHVDNFNFWVISFLSVIDDSSYISDNSINLQKNKGFHFEKFDKDYTLYYFLVWHKNWPNSK